MDKIRAALTGKKGLVIYITAGFPDYQECEKAIIAAIQAGADVIEIGMPFSDPLADGPILQKASNDALAAGATTQKNIQLVAKLREKVATPLLIMTYINPVFAYGLDKFAADAKTAGLDGLILPDVPEEENELVAEILKKHDLVNIHFLAPTSETKRIEKISQKAKDGFIYCLARTGVTGVGGGLDAGSEKLIKAARAFTDLPLAMGFGITDASSVRQAVEYADAAIVGSAVVETLRKGGAKAVGDFVRELRVALD